MNEAGTGYNRAMDRDQRYGTTKLDAPNHRWAVRESRPGTARDGQDAKYRRTSPHEPDLGPDVDPDDRLFLIGERIADLSARINSAEYEMLTLIAEFDERKGWEVDGFGSCAEWLAWRIGVRPVTARERVRAALALRTLPETSQAMQEGELSFSKVRALTRVATPESEPELLELARAGSAENLERVVRRWKHLTDKGELSLEQRRYKNRAFSIFIDEDGMYVVKGRLTPEVGALFMRAIEATGDELYRESPAAGSRAVDTQPAEPQQRRADAMGLLAELALGKVEALETEIVGADANKDAAPKRRRFSGTRADRYQVMIHVSMDTLEGKTGPDEAVSSSHIHRSEIEDVRVTAETSRRHCCDAAVLRIVYDPEGQVLDVGRKTRVISDPLRRALDARDRGCRFPGCGSRYTAGHHINHWADGGPTDLKNLMLLCPRHHTAVHEGGVKLVVGVHGNAAFFTPDGRILGAVPPRARDDRGMEDSNSVTGPSRLPATPGESDPQTRPVWRTGGARHKHDRLIPWDVEARARKALDS